MLHIDSVSIQTVELPVPPAVSTCWLSPVPPQCPGGAQPHCITPAALLQPNSSADLVSVLPLILLLLRPVHKGKEKKGNTGCVFLVSSRGYIYFFFLEVAVNIVRQGKEQAYICAMRYRNISIGILLYSQFPYP